MVFRKTPHFFLPLMAALFLYEPASTQDLPQACKTDGILSQNSPTIIHQTKEFKRGTKRYPFAAYSIWALHPKRKNILCFRYEIDSRGKIEEFRWDDVGQFSGTDIPPRYKEENEQYSLSKNATSKATTVKAFENSTSLFDAWFTVEKAADRRLTAVEPGAEMSMFDIETRLPEFVATLKNLTTTLEPIAAFSYPTGPREYAQIHTRLSVGSVNLTAMTFAKFDGTRFFTTTTVSAAGMKAAFSPALMAIRKSSRGPLGFDLGSLKTAANLLREYVGAPMRIERDQAIDVLEFRGEKNTGLPQLYVIEHPITIVAGTQALCIRVSSYSPLPLNVGAQYCNRSVIKKKP